MPVLAVWLRLPDAKEVGKGPDAFSPPDLEKNGEKEEAVCESVGCGIEMHN